MKTSEYQQLALVTESRDMESIQLRIGTERAIRLLHGGIGLATEAGEFLDGIKKYVFYGKAIDTVNLSEEMGDLFWYIAIVCDELGVAFDDVMETNIAKLKARYHGKFSEYRATNRDLANERAVLEKDGVRYRLPVFLQDTDPDKVICDTCMLPATEIPWYCVACGKDLGKGGALIRIE